ncbi:MAG: class I SAM-dependent methyltransferase [Opitutae bacterium]|nr:class I SAM-dependent methyltransferase [Opitutae bacterium]
MNSQNAGYKETWNALAATAESAYAHVAGYSDEQRLKASAETTVAGLRQTIGVHPTDTFLEIGCGVGRVGRELAPLVAHWIGCDVSENMLQHAQHRLQGVANVSLTPISGYDLRPIPDRSVDAVYCTVVFMHLQEWDRYAYVCEAFRILKPGGRFFCDNANLASDEGWNLFLASAAFPPSNRPQHLSRCSTVPEIDCFLRRAGFQEVQTKTTGVWVFGWGVKPTQT